MSDYFWPGEDEPGEYILEHQDPCVTQRPRRWTGFMWDHESCGTTTRELIRNGYLGVRREPAAQPVEATPKPRTLTPDPDDANAAYAASVMTRLRAAKKPGEFERIALECVPNLCQMLGAS